MRNKTKKNNIFVYINEREGEKDDSKKDNNKKHDMGKCVQRMKRKKNFTEHTLNTTTASINGL